MLGVLHSELQTRLALYHPTCTNKYMAQRIVRLLLTFANFTVPAHLRTFAQKLNYKPTNKEGTHNQFNGLWYEFIINCWSKPFKSYWLNVFIVCWQKVGKKFSECKTLHLWYFVIKRFYKILCLYYFTITQKCRKKTV